MFSFLGLVLAAFAQLFNLTRTTVDLIADFLSLFVANECVLPLFSADIAAVAVYGFFLSVQQLGGHTYIVDVPVALSHCLTGAEGDIVYIIPLKTPESTTKFTRVPETTGKPESQESVSVALSHFFVHRQFQFSETQNASDIISFYPSLNKSAYF